MEAIIKAALIESAAIPLGSALVLTGVIRFALGYRRGTAAAATAIGIAFLIAYAFTLTWPPFPPVASNQKLPYIVLAGLAAGLAIDVSGRPKFLEGVAVFAGPAAVIVWLGWRKLASPNLEFGITAFILFASGVFVLASLAPKQKPEPAAPVMLLVASVGASGVAFFGAAESLAQLFGAVAAASGGFLLWNWPVPRYPFGAAAILGAGGAFITLMVMLILFSDSSKIALAVILLVFLAPPATRRIRFGAQRGIGPVILGLVCTVPVAVALVIAFTTSGGILNLSAAAALTK